MSATLSGKLHFVLVPLMAQGHMIPIFDIAQMLGHRGIITTIYTTPMNASRFRPTVARTSELGLPIRLVEVPFRSDEVGLPDGCENLDSLPSPGLLRKFHCALEKMQEPVEAHLRQNGPPPSCIISDRAVFWTADIARKFGIPRFLFNGMSCFSRVGAYNVEQHFRSEPDYYLKLGATEPFEIAGMPKAGLKLNKSQLPSIFRVQPNLDDFRMKVREAEKAAQGLIINSFDEIEDECTQLYENAIGQKIWCIGPVSLCNKNTRDRLDRGNKASEEVKRCTEWLDAKNPRTVVYACLGSMCRLVAAQLIELGKGLEASNRPFIWVLKTGGDDGTLELEKWLREERFEERTQGRGFIIRGWAPQLAILSHRSVGAFLTHCGWNSTLEGLSSGIPMITWPLFCEQFINEAMVVDVLKVGVRVGVEVAVKFGDEDKVGVMVRDGEVLRAVEEVMSGGEEGVERRRKAVEYAEKAREAVEVGGTSYSNLSNLIQYVAQELSLQGEASRSK